MSLFLAMSCACSFPGVPQIEVTFDLDANGILNVTAENKESGNKNKITITNDTGRLTKEQIERMVADAERFKAEDEKHAQRVSAKNKLEQYIYGLRTTVSDEKLKDKVSGDDRSTIEKLIKDTQSWLDGNDSASSDEYEAKQKEVEGTAQPIMMKIYQAGGAPGVGGMPDFGGEGAGDNEGASASAGSSSGPKVEEVD